MEISNKLNKRNCYRPNPPIFFFNVCTRVIHLILLLLCATRLNFEQWPLLVFEIRSVVLVCVWCAFMAWNRSLKIIVAATFTTADWADRIETNDENSWKTATLMSAHVGCYIVCAFKGLKCLMDFHWRLNFSFNLNEIMMCLIYENIFLLAFLVKMCGENLLALLVPSNVVLIYQNGSSLGSFSFYVPRIISKWKTNHNFNKFIL